ncbi:MAG: Dihydroorotate dehydrogenase (quinone), mitochondrial [Caeruleum heppii]|nr:MAG: Dihydroorotate dehydrogenase (quinone), mitochondrial [Caeruleum heppii]
MSTRGLVNPLRSSRSPHPRSMYAWTRFSTTTFRTTHRFFFRTTRCFDNSSRRLESRLGHTGWKRSISSTASTDARSTFVRSRNLVYGTSIALLFSFGYFYATDTRSAIHEWVVVPLLRWKYEDAEEAHEAGTNALKALYGLGLHPRERGNPDGAGDLSVEVFGHKLSNPIGTSAGIDKHADIPSALLAIGPAIVEIGGATPYPQDGNAKPRVFRLPSQNALINRYGLNSEGADHIAMRLRQRVREYAYAMGFGLEQDGERRVLDGEAGVPPGSLSDGKLLAVQVAKNKATNAQDIEAVKRDYVYCVDALAKYADIVVVNVSSPNTPGLRGLQQLEPLTHILKGVVNAAQSVDRNEKPRVMVKISPDEDKEDQIAGICDAVWQAGVDGVIVGNTTNTRPEPLPEGYRLSPKEQALLKEQGGYSGPQLFQKTVSLVKTYRSMLDARGNSAESEHRPLPTSETPSKDDVNSRAKGDSTTEDVLRRISATQKSEEQLLDQAMPQDKSQPLIRLPERHSLFSSSPTPGTDVDTTPSASSLPSPKDLIPDSLTPSKPSTNTATASPNPPSSSIFSSPSSSTSSPEVSPRPRKVIFATGGITNGARALEVLDAGASVAMVYTALVYGGVGTISKMKGEMRKEIQRRGPAGSDAQSRS